MNAQDELDRISDRLRGIDPCYTPPHVDPNLYVNLANGELVRLHSISCPCELCGVARYKEKLIRERKHGRVASLKLQAMLRDGH